jgi:hypothetical protein
MVFLFFDIPLPISFCRGLFYYHLQVLPLLVHALVKPKVL